MQASTFGKLKKRKTLHRPEVSGQTGFPSAATHYAEPTIDLHNELVSNQEATFFIRIDGDGYESFAIHHNDVLIVDRSLQARKNDLLLVVIDGDFQVIKAAEKHEEPFQLWGVITYIIHKAR